DAGRWTFNFRFRESIQQEADNFLRRSMAQFDLSPSDIAVMAVHIRRTYLLQLRIQEGILPAGKSYFSHAIAFLNRRLNNKTMCIVCSDDMKLSKVNFVTESPTVFFVDLLCSPSITGQTSSLLVYLAATTAFSPLLIRPMVSLHGR
ncbi:hypothetical protein LSAT2_031016, partial [Lamellibrachia satsuma]